MLSVFLDGPVRPVRLLLVIVMVPMDMVVLNILSMNFAFFTRPQPHTWKNKDREKKRNKQPTLFERSFRLLPGEKEQMSLNVNLQRSWFWFISRDESPMPFFLNAASHL